MQGARDPGNVSQLLLFLYVCIGAKAHQLGEERKILGSKIPG